MHTRTAAAVLLACAGLAVGCSSSSSHDDKPTAAPTSTAVTTPATTSASPADERTALTDAVKAYSAAYFKPDAAAAGKLLSARCRAQTSADAYKAALARAVATYGHQQIKTVTVDRLSGTLALVSYTYSVPVLDQHGQPWVLESAAWRYDAC